MGKPHTDKHPLQLLPAPQELHFQPLTGHSQSPEPSPSPRGHLCDAVSGNEAQLAVTRKRTARIFRRIPFKHFTSLFPGFHSIASPANRARFALQRHKEADGKLSTCLIAGNQRFTLHLPLSFPSSTTHRPELKNRKPQRGISIQDANLL